MFTLKNFANAVINSDSVVAKVVGYTALAAIGIGADAISAKKAEEAPAPATEEIVDEVTEVIHDDDDVVVEVVHDEVYDDSADRQEEDELFETAIKSTSNSFVMSCEEAIGARNFGDEEAAMAMEEMARYYLEYLHLNLGREEDFIVVHNAREALAAFRTFGSTRIEWM